MQVIERSKPKKKSMFASPKVDNQSPLGQFPIVAVDSILEDESEHYPLFKAFSSLKDYPKVKLIKVVPHIRKIPNYAEMVAYPELYIKKDETINSTFGGIAIRKLEYLFGQAKRMNCQTVHCFGYLNSQFCTAVVAHARQFGLKPKVSLCKCPISEEVQLNLKLLKNFEPLSLDLISEDELEQLKNKANQQTSEIINGTIQEVSEMILPYEGNTVYTQLGLLNAIYELEEQITGGDAQQPGAIFIPCQSGCTAAGLLLGLVLAGLNQTIIYAVQCQKNCDKKVIVDQAMQLYSWVKKQEDSMKCVDRKQLEEQILFIPGYFAGDQFCLSVEAEEIKKSIANIDFIELDSYQGAKTFSALSIILTKLKQVIKEKVVLFWNNNCIQWQQFKDLEIEVDEFPQEFQLFFGKEAIDSKIAPAGSIVI